MTATLESQQFSMRHAARQPCKLLHGPVFVVIALDGKYRTCDRRDTMLYVPCTECGVKPHIVPSPECAIGVVVILAELRSHIRRQIGPPGIFDAGDGHVLHEQMWRKCDDASGAVRRQTGVD